MIKLSSFYPISIPTGSLVYTTGNQTISGVKRFAQRPNVNGSGVLLIGEDRVGNYYLNSSYPKQYLKQIGGINSIPSGLNLKNNDIINIGFGDILDTTVGSKAKTLKVNPGILINQNPLLSGSRNYLPFANSHPDYSGKAIQKIRYNSTIGNGYEKINLTNLSLTGNPAIIRPLTRRLETFYDINVPSGGGVRALKFVTPTSPFFVQGLCMNLRFNFAADNNPCIISGYWQSEMNAPLNTIFLLTGANYSFIQKERVILINKSGYHEFKHW